MKPGYYIAIMLAPVLATAYLVSAKRSRGMGETWASAFVRLAFLGLLVFIAFHVPRMSPTDSATEPPWTYPALFFSMIAALFFVRSTWIAVMATAIWFLLCIYNWPLYNSIFEARNLTWNPWFRKATAQKQYDDIVSDVLISYKGRSHAAAFIEDVGPDARDALEMWTERRPLLEYRIQKEWYTPFTGVFHVTSRPAHILFKGGSFDQGGSAFILVGQGDFR